MTVFKRTRWNMAAGVGYVAIGALAGWLVANVSGWPLAMKIVLPVVFAALLFWIILLDEDIRLELEDGGELRYYQRGKLKKTIDAKTVRASRPAGAEGKTRLSAREMMLFFSDGSGGREERLDCSPIGSTQYLELCRRLMAFAQAEADE